VEQERWAAAHYRVERESSGVVMRKRQRRKATEMAITLGDPVPDEPHDVVRVYDRSGAVVFEQDWGTNRSGAMAQEARIIDDLLHLDVFSFRGRYGIAEPEAAPASRRSRTTSPKTRKAQAKGARKTAARTSPSAKGATGRRKRGSG